MTPDQKATPGTAEPVTAEAFCFIEMHDYLAVACLTAAKLKNSEPDSAFLADRVQAAMSAHGCVTLAADELRRAFPAGRWEDESESASELVESVFGDALKQTAALNEMLDPVSKLGNDDYPKAWELIESAAVTQMCDAIDAVAGAAFCLTDLARGHSF